MVLESGQSITRCVPKLITPGSNPSEVGNLIFRRRRFKNHQSVEKGKVFSVTLIASISDPFSATRTSTMKLGLLFIGLLAVVVAETGENAAVVAVEEAPAQLIDELDAAPLSVDEPGNGVRDKRTLLLKKKILLKKALLLGG